MICKTLQRSYQNLIKKSKKSILPAEECFFHEAERTISFLFCFFTGLRARSSHAISRSAATAISAVGMAPARIMAVPFVAFDPLTIISPRPPAPTKVPIAVMPMAMTSAVRRPAIMTESASGSSTIRRIWYFVMPIAFPDSR
ncbi:hypothetical protein MUS_3701 [Bacillus velezensis YAU B9601-Y2]|uniref:Uncharacterized protein n=1 Tax=Bacillus amyloliquefaciens (strain Y2) TaxID=1155777 RepID=I2CA94_BACAY|nr:hypothetical protein MUS_3701 [Bacillus velezensis YAU B9601-Y2]